MIIIEKHLGKLCNSNFLKNYPFVNATIFHGLGTNDTEGTENILVYIHICLYLYLF